MLETAPQALFWEVLFLKSFSSPGQGDAGVLHVARMLPCLGEGTCLVYRGCCMSPLL